ncbi:hypothetical protein PEX1_056510 [Penicillium expansum]|uniref:FAD/NAD(P)-binding domain-containing protein n=1 Tax=Penicillium expansum TaxID=27334 RepID=A0A0A2I3I9_PENEN|nr:hypothetical protein PEX2_009550 [Penicillium expansum]KGO36947.1 hypothetical protein PEXP_007470 [Penicillium expansum]KGO37669.1 hypothetical protein PEX1_056510 [Penicillium expansum]KGO51388.1 hypothetical protein PEX2_009550 [Penicillium expansum]
MTVPLLQEGLGGQINVNPGCAVDIPAVFYSLSFAPNPDFSKVYPPQAEILEYFNRVADKFDVSRHIVRNTEWEGAYWQDLTNSWLVKLKDLSTGQTFYHECKILISAVGALVNPNPFGVPGAEVFEGDIVHTAAWKADLSLHQKDVIVIGNGCSAAQLIPAISQEAQSITQFIRRRIFDNNRYISCLQQRNIHLTDDPIVKVSSHSILTKSGQEYPADAILLATGFALTQYDVELVGRNGRTRDEHWGNFGYKEAYKSTAMAGFPNFFYVLGPNSGKGHTSAIYCIENYVKLVMKVIAPVLQGHASFVEVKPDSEKDYNESLHEKIATTIFNSSCSSYFIDYKSQKNWFIYPWNSFVMWYSTHWSSSDDWTYDIDM